MTTIPASRTPASEARPAPGRTFVAFLTMASAIIVGVMTLLAGPASASTLTSTQNVVGVIGHAGGQRVGAHEGVLAGQGRARAPNYDRMASASCVGAETGSGTLNLSTDESWGNQSTLQDHFDRHGPDFSSTSPDAYAGQASQFLQEGLQGQAEVKIDSNGVIRVYDPQTNTFGAYNPDGTTRTVFKPSSGASYWANQPGSSPWGS